MKSSKASKETIDYIIKRLKKIYESFIFIEYDYLLSLNLEEVEILIFSGGDGVFHNIINYTINYDIVYGYIPLGTANDMASNLKIKSIDEALKKIENNKVDYYSLLSINEEYFLYACSIGNMSNVSLRTDKKEKRVFGKWIYILKGIKYFLKPKTVIVIKEDNNISIKYLKLLLLLKTNYLGGCKISNDNNRLNAIEINNIIDLIKLFVFHKTPNNEISKVTIYSKGPWCCDGETVKSKINTINISDKKVKILL